MRCTRLYELVPVDQQPLEADVDVIQHEIPSLDFRCSRCGASQTYKLVPGRAMESTS